MHFPFLFVDFMLNSHPLRHLSIFPTTNFTQQTLRSNLQNSHNPDVEIDYEYFLFVFVSLIEVTSLSIILKALQPYH